MIEKQWWGMEMIDKQGWMKNSGWICIYGLNVFPFYFPLIFFL